MSLQGEFIYMTKTIFDNINPETFEKVQKLRLIDDELMSIVFSGDKKVTQFLIRILLNRNDLIVKKSMTQVQKSNLFGRSVRLDIVAEDIFKQQYNIEIQRDGAGAGGKRIRYHQAMLDSHTLKKGDDFNKLPTLYIIFILEHDIFKQGKPIYFVNKTLNIKDEDGEYLLFDDACNIMYVNGDYRGDNSLGKLMHDFSTPNADEMYYNELARKVRFHKQDERGIEMASKIVEEYGDQRAAEALKLGIQQGLQQGEQKKAVEDALMLISKYNATPEEAAKDMNAPLELVLEKLKKEE